MGAPDSGRADPHIERTRRSPEINQAGIGEADQDDGCKCQKRRRHLSAALWQGKKASNPRPTVLETVALPTELFPYMIKKWWAFRDLNPGPTGYEPVALTN